jgi:hypothetical protein
MFYVIVKIITINYWTGKGFSVNFCDCLIFEHLEDAVSVKSKIEADQTILARWRKNVHIYNQEGKLI